MTSIILTKTHLYADQQTSTDRGETHACRDCHSPNVLRVKQKDRSKIVIPEINVDYRGSRILAIASAGNSTLIKKATDLLLKGACPVKTVRDFQSLFDFKPGTSCTMLVVTEDRSFRLVLSASRVEVGEVTKYPIVIGSGASLAKVIWTLFPTIKPMKVMATLVQHDPSTGVAVDKLKYISKRREIKHYHIEDLPRPLKDLKVPK